MSTRPCGAETVATPRNDILDRDLNDTGIDPGDDCTVRSGTLNDPFTGDQIDFDRGEGSDEVHIHHLVSAAVTANVV